ncbi:hypothetical protein C6T59_16780 [Burkholderia multivorans]|uniref:Uncharacterized protein n=1 Tax=Burkholderia multivorans TaxID=87883 RepID=A0A2S9MR05_9BURK|nr:MULTISPECIES: hypothetical protein [Burkholderia cepacia complex]MBR7896905.1 hypothetical protein [Burkholderia multivorans]MBR8049001.1 hypothetical protein [Burkholderia multivorans]MBU9144155.1 hypothetical protein [Burkholderia multivorans]MBU9438296.1 hypothetical protein [Burkholderia multivorans]MBU9513870.1 hypothetical protein [Burkholderia multivorans]
MEPLTCDYVPPYVRAEAGEYKYAVEVEICGEYYLLPPTEMPGERDWYRDFKKLIGRMYISWFCSLSRDQWEITSFEMVRSLHQHTGLHVIEARAVVREAIVGAERLMEIDNDRVFRDEYPVVAAMYDVEYKRQLARLQAIVKACPETVTVPLEAVRQRTRRSNRKVCSAKNAPTASSGEAS